jgi:hypothetical protein
MIRLQQLADGWSAYVHCSISPKASEGYGRSGPVYPLDHDYRAEDPHELWPDRSAAFSAALLQLAKQAEDTLIEAELHRTWHGQARRGAED